MPRNPLPRDHRHIDAEDPLAGVRLPDEISLDELETALRIDRNDLETSLSSQPDAFYQVAKQVMRLTSQRDATKQRLAELEAELDASLRHEAEVADEKITEKQVESEKRRDSRIKQCHSELLRANHKLGMAIALKEAFIQRSYALKDLCGLQINNLYAADQVREPTAYRTRLAERARTGMAEQRRERLR